MHHLRRLLRSSRICRALFAFIGVMAVWNLGCVGLQPLLVSMIGSSASIGVVCDAEGMLAVPTATPRLSSASADSLVRTAAPSNVNATVAAAPSSRDAAGHSVNCGCQSCSAPPSALRTLAAVGATVPLAPIGNPGTPPSTSRTPLVPPPQGTL